MRRVLSRQLWRRLGRCAFSSGVETTRVSVGNRVLGGDYYNDPQERPWKPRDTTLFFDFRVVHSVDAVERVVRGFGSEISVAHLCGALTRLRQLRSHITPSFLTLLSERVLARMSDFEARHFAAVWLAMARFQFADAAFYEALATESARPNFLQAYTPVHISNIVYGVGLIQKTHDQRLGRKLQPSRTARRVPSDAFRNLTPFLQSVVSQTLLTTHVARFNEVQLASVVYGLGLARFEPTSLPSPLWSEVVAADRRRRFSEGELSNLLYGMVLMGIESHDPMLQTLVEEITQPNRLQSMAEAQLTCFVYCLRLLAYDIQRHLIALRDEISHPMRLRHLTEQSLSMILTNLRTLGMSDTASVGPILMEFASERVLEKITPQGLSMALYNYALSDFHATEILEKLISAAMKPHQIENYTPNDLSNLIYALSSVDYENDAVLEPLRQRLADPSLMEQFEPGHVSNVLRGSGKLRFFQTLPHALRPLLHHRTVHRLTSAQIVNALYGISQSSPIAEATVQALVDESVREERLEGFSADQLASLVSSLGRMGCRRDTVWKALLQQVVNPNRIGQFSTTGLMRVLSGIAGSGFRDAQLLGSFLQEIILPSRLEDFMPTQLSSLVMSLGRIGVEDRRVLTPILKELMKDTNLTELEPQRVMNALYGLSQLEAFDEQIWERLSAEIRRPERLEQLKGTEFTRLLFAYGMKQWKHPVVYEILSLLQQSGRLKDFTTMGLASCLYSLAQMDLQDSPCVDLMAQEFVQTHHLEHATPHHISNVVFSLGALKSTNKEAVEKLVSAIKDRIEAFSRHGLYNLFFGLGQLQYKDPTLLDALWKESLKLERLLGFTEREWATIAYSLDQLGYKKEDDVIRLRAKILMNRGLPITPLPKIHSKHELTSEDIQQIRAAHQETLNQRIWLDEKNVVQTKSRHEKYRQMSFANWRDRSQTAYYPPRNESVYRAQDHPTGPALLPDTSHKGMRRRLGRAVKRRVMVFNQTMQDVSDDEMPEPRPRPDAARRERIISPWTSPYYNLRVVQWPESPGPAKTVNADFEEQLQDPYEDPEATSEDEFRFEERVTPVASVQSRKPSRGSFQELMETHKHTVRQRDQAAMEELAEGLSNLFSKDSNTDAV